MSIVIITFLMASALCFGAELESREQKDNANEVTAHTRSNPDQDTAGSLRSFLNDPNVILPDQPIVADVMAVQSSTRVQELLGRFKQSISQHPEWWMQYVKKQPEGEKLPYHPNLGISEAEYKEMLRAMDHLTFGKVGEATLMFENQGAGRVKISSPELAQALANIIVDFKNGFTETPYGRLGETKYVNNSDPNAPSGPWAGPSWGLAEPAGEEPYGTVVTFALGRRSKDSRGVLYYKVRRVLPNQPPEKIDLFLLYDAPNE